MGTEGGLSFDKFKLPHAYVFLLAQLIDEGKGHGRLDIQGRIEVGPTKTILPGSPVDWLKLCAYGCIIGREDRLGEIEITPLGTTFVEEHRLRLKGG